MTQRLIKTCMNCKWVDNYLSVTRERSRCTSPANVDPITGSQVGVLCSIMRAPSGACCTDQLWEARPTTVPDERTGPAMIV